MKPRLNLNSVSPEGYNAVLALSKYTTTNVDPVLHELVKVRASVLNGCAFCLDMHTREAMAAGESARRLFAVSAWHEAPFFTPQERAALRLTDALTHIGPDGVSDSVWDEAAQFWSEKELVDLVLSIATINVWNRLALSARLQPPAA